MAYEEILTKTAGDSYYLPKNTTIPAAANNGKLTIQANGSSKGTFTANQSGDTTVNITPADLGLSSAMKFLGVSSTAITNGGTENPTIGGTTITPVAGNVVIYNHLEFVRSTDGKWEQLGDESSYALKTSIGNGTITIKQAGSTKGSFSVNQSGNTTIELTDNNTHYTTKLITGASSSASANAAATNGNVYLNLFDDSTLRNSHNIVGTGATTVTCDANGKITINSTDTNTNTTYSAGTGLSLSNTTFNVNTGYTTSGKNYAVKTDSNDNLYVNVPWTDNNTTYPVYTKTIDKDFKTKFRTETKGNTNSGGYIAAIRNDTASVSNSPQHGSGLAWGMGDTHGYLYMNYSSAEAYIGAGNADQLSWVKGLSFSDHTHSYAGSSSAGGSATSAVKLDTTTAGSATKPVYFSDGKPVVCTYSINADVPSDAKFTDTHANNFGKVTYGSTTISAGAATDTLTLAVSGGAGLTLDTTNKKVTISAPSAYTLPNATSSTLGGVKIGSNINVSSGTISVPTGSTSALGVLKVGSNLTVSSGTLSLTKANTTSALGYTPCRAWTVTIPSGSSGSTAITVSGASFSKSPLIAKSSGSDTDYNKITAVSAATNSLTFTLSSATSAALTLMVIETF